MAERLEWPPGQIPGGPVLDRPFVLHGRFEGPAAEAVLGLSGALGYGCLVEDAPAGRLQVHIEPSGGRTVLWLVRDLNRQLGAMGAAIGIDAVNGRLILSGTGGRP
jgi:hypothetical protein